MRHAAMGAFWTATTTAGSAWIITGALVLSVLGGWAFTSGVLAALSVQERPSRAGRRRGRRAATIGRRPARRSARLAARRSGGLSAGRSLGVDAPRRMVRPPSRAGQNLLRGGLAIGLLERAAVTLALLSGHGEALAVIVAIKGLGRFAELREQPAAAERFVVGSLASLLWAAVVGYVARALLG